MNTKQHELLQKLEHYCSYQERFVSDVIMKLQSLGTDKKTTAKIIALLQENHFLDEERAIQTFVKSKINKKWGFNKIRYTLRTKEVDLQKINKAFSEFDNETYCEELKKLLQAKKIHETDPYKKQVKLARYAIQKGYEPGLVSAILKKLHTL